MADAATKYANTGLRSDALFRVIQAGYNALVGTDAVGIRNRSSNRVIGFGPDNIQSKNRLLGYPVLADATAAGKIKFTLNGTNVQLVYSINGQVYTKAATDDFWNFTAEVDTIAAKYRAYYLLIDNAGNASFLAQTAADSASAAAATAALLADGRPPVNKCVVGIFVAGPSTDFSADAIVAKAGATIKAGLDEAMDRVWPGQILNGSTAGKIQTTGLLQYVLAQRGYTKQPTDNLWDLSAEVDTIANQYRGYRLYLDASGVATFVATANVVNVVAATAQASVRTLLAALPEDRTKTLIGEIICGPSTDFSADAILTKTGALTYVGYSSDLSLTAYQASWRS